MSMNMVQFQKGLSLLEFLEHYGTEAKCKAELEAKRWPKGFVCPECGHSEHCVVYHNGCKTFQCTHCRTQTTLTSGTIFQNTRLPLFKWFYAMYLMTQSKNNVSALELTRVLGVCYVYSRDALKLMTPTWEGNIAEGRLVEDRRTRSRSSRRFRRPRVEARNTRCTRRFPPSVANR